MERRRFQFQGRVQGVGFRATARGIARGFSVSGWVRNEPDGSVVAEVQGAAAEVGAFIEELKRRMGRNIHAISSDPCPVEAGERGFEVRR